MFFKKKMKYSDDSDSLTMNIKKELINSLKKVGVDISEINIDMGQNNLSVAVYVDKSGNINRR